MQVYCHRLLLSDHQIKYFLKKRKMVTKVRNESRSNGSRLSFLSFLGCTAWTVGRTPVRHEIEGTHLSTQPITWLARTKSRSSGTRLEKWTQMSGQCPPSPCWIRMMMRGKGCASWRGRPLARVSSASFACSGTRSSPASRWARAWRRFRRAAPASGTCWSGTPFPAPSVDAY